MKNPYDVLKMKEQELIRVRREMDALRIAAHHGVHHLALTDCGTNRLADLYVVGWRDHVVRAQLADEAAVLRSVEV